MNTSLRLLAISALAALFSVNAQATTTLYNYDFGQIIGQSSGHSGTGSEGNGEHGASSGYQPSATFATLAVSTTDNRAFTFTLNLLSNLDSQFSIGAYSSGIMFNTATDADPNNKPTISNVTASGLKVTSNGVSKVTLNPSNQEIAGYGFDFTDNFGTGNNKLTQGESISWIATFSNIQPNPFLGLPAAALHIQWSGNGEEADGWYVPSNSVIEPGSVLLITSGLGYLVAMRRRRRVENPSQEIIR